MALPLPYWRQPGYKRISTTSVKTANPWEALAAQKLMDEGWRVYKKGWPDFMAVKGNTIRFIEIKPPMSKKRYPYKFSRFQQAMADILRRFYAIEVELWNRYDHFGISNEGLIEPMGAGARESGATVESPRGKQENTLSLSPDTAQIPSGPSLLG